jgi:ABC-type uncharacterized transport system permease subunit
MSGLAFLVSAVAAIAIPIGFVAYAIASRRISWRMAAALLAAECAALLGVVLSNAWEMSNC